MKVEEAIEVLRTEGWVRAADRLGELFGLWPTLAPV